jgi:serine acetyltransferase
MLKIILTFGMLGDYNIIRKYTKKSKIFYPWYKMYEIWHCANLPLQTKFTGYVNFPHSPKGCFFSMFASIGQNCTIMQHVTIGSNNIMGGGWRPYNWK